MSEEYKQDKEMQTIADAMREADIENNLANANMANTATTPNYDRNDKDVRDIASQGQNVEERVESSGANVVQANGAHAVADNEPLMAAAAPNAAYSKDQLEAAERFNKEPSQVTQEDVTEHKERELEEREAVNKTIEVVAKIFGAGVAFNAFVNTVDTLSNVDGPAYACNECPNGANDIPSAASYIEAVISGPVQQTSLNT